MVEQVQQSSDEWLAWRRKGIGASEVPIIMGESEYSTPRELWKLKTGRKKEEFSNFAMQRGQEMEPRIRAMYSILFDFDMPPFIWQHPDYPFMRASLDGWNEEHRRILEIKFTSEDVYNAAKERKELPLKYKGQVQAQLFVVNGRQVDFCAYNKDRIAVVEVLPDAEYQSVMLQKCKDFWQYVITDTMPPMTDRDFHEYDDPTDKLLFEVWLKAKAEGSKKAIDMAREAIIARIGEHKRVLCAGVKVIRNVKGVVTISVA